MNQKNQQQIINIMKETVSMLCIFFLFISCKNQDNKVIQKDFSDKIQELVLSENKIGQEYFFKILLRDQVLEYKIVYLGDIENNKEGNLKFIVSTIYSGNYEDSKRANSRVFIYTKNNDKKGYYYIGGVLKAPLEIKESDLYLPIQNSNCDESTMISFKDSIPKEIFINCTKAGGDFYNFEVK